MERLLVILETSNTALPKYVGVAESQHTATWTVPGPEDLTADSGVVSANAQRTRKHHDNSHRLRVKLPRWFTSCVWEFGVLESDNMWTYQIRSINVRPSRTLAFDFDFVRSGDVKAVWRLIRSGDLSVHDHEDCPTVNYSILEVILALSLKAVVD